MIEKFGMFFAILRENLRARAKMKHCTVRVSYTKLLSRAQSVGETNFILICHSLNHHSTLRWKYFSLLMRLTWQVCNSKSLEGLVTSKVKAFCTLISQHRLVLCWLYMPIYVSERRNCPSFYVDRYVDIWFGAARRANSFVEKAFCFQN